MSKNLSRRDFLKGAAASLAGAAAMGVLGACSNEPVVTTGAPESTAGTTEATTTSSAPEGLYIPGTYSSTATGIGTVTVTMTFDANSITDVVLDVSAESDGYGKDAAETLRQALLTAQSSEIDVVSGSTSTSKAVIKAAAKSIQQAKGEIPVEIIENKKDTEGEPADWLGVAPEIDETLITQTWNTDILIVGAGGGGTCAGAYAASKGYKFRLIEKAGVTCRNRGWYGAVDSSDILATGAAPVDRAALKRELQRYGSGKINMSAFNTWINESAAMHEFVKSVYGEIAPDAVCNVSVAEEATWPEAEESGFNFFEIEHTWSGGPSRNELFRQYMEGLGYNIDFNTAMIKLEKDGNRITGVIAQNTDTEEYIRINASKGVILTTGGYPGNSAMMEQLDPMAVAVTTTNVCTPEDTGDGIKAAMWVGASMQAESAPMLFDRGSVPPGVNSGYVTLESGDKVFPGTEGQFGFCTQPFLKVNRRGERFTNESGTYDFMSYAAYNQPGGVYAQIFDSNMPTDVVRFHTLGCSAGPRKAPDSVMKQMEGKIEKGITFKCDTLEELADKLGFDAEGKKTFLATCERYNELYDMGEDEDFGKQAYRLSELRTPPFYGHWVGACLLTTEQGILVDKNAQVLDANRQPMPGLYAAGDTTGGFFVNNYPCLMPGVAMGRTLTFAIKAVKVASGEEV